MSTFVISLFVYGSFALWGSIILVGIALHTQAVDSGEPWWTPFAIPYYKAWVAYGNYRIRIRRYGRPASKPLMAV